VSSALKPVQVPSTYRNISEHASVLIPVLYSLSPTFVDANQFGVIELGLVVNAVLFADSVHLKSIGKVLLKSV